MKRTALALLATILASCLLAACSGGGTSGNGESGMVASSGATSAPTVPANSETLPGSESTAEGVTTYSVGDQYIVEIPDVEGMKISQIEDRVTIVDADKRWVLLLTYSTKAGTTPEEYMLGVDVPPEDAQPYITGNISGYRYQRETSSGQVYMVAVVFNSLAQGEAHVGIIELEINMNMEGGDAAVFFDEQVVQDILESIHAPE